MRLIADTSERLDLFLSRSLPQHSRSKLVKLIDAGSGEGQAAVLEAIASGLAAGTEDAREGKASFAQRRAAQYKGS